MVERSSAICFQTPESEEIPLDPQLEPFANATERVIGKLRQKDETIRDPLVNTREDGGGRSWHWVDITTPGVLAQTGLCLVLEPERRTDLQLNVKTRISDKRDEDTPIDWNRVVKNQEWKISDLQNKPEQLDTFEFAISNSLQESFQDVLDKEDVIFLYKKKLERESR